MVSVVLLCIRTVSMSKQVLLKILTYEQRVKKREVCLLCLFFASASTSLHRTYFICSLGDTPAKSFYRLCDRFTSSRTFRKATW